MSRPVPEQLTIDGRAEPHEDVVKNRARTERSRLGRVWAETERAVREALRPGQKEDGK